MTKNKRISREIINATQFSQEITVFHGREAPEKGILVGYGVIIDVLNLAMPIPGKLALISEKHRQYQNPEWSVFTPRHRPPDTLYGNLVFSLKYEGVNLLFFKKLFDQVEEQAIESLVQNEPLSQYSRKIWFLYEWLMQKSLNLPDLKEGNYIPLIDGNLQYTMGKGINSSRHRIRNNLPGTINFCPLINKSEKLEEYIKEDLSEKTAGFVRNVHNDILSRTSAFLLLRDSKASFNIEGETPSNSRAIRWGKVMGQAGNRPLSKEELLRLQQIVIENTRFIRMGFREEGGFVGEHDRSTGEPIPEHISARWQDLNELLNGLMETDDKLEKSEFHPVLTAAMIAFGFLFIHPFVDGNGRIHRYLIHHILAKMNFTPRGIIFPVSAAILERIDDYRKVLESYSHPLLDFIEWKTTEDHNIEVLNNTADYYKYYDATLQAEFLFDCIDYTIRTVIPEEVSYLQNYDQMKAWLDDNFEMPDKMVALLIRFLDQNNGKLSRRVKNKEFQKLTVEETKEIEKQYKIIFLTR
ncbi:MAG: Fic family protein [Bacteroidales bacterium]|nr:Fic family protein [Bacteroidales bacterium]MBN2698860.1 Fic family protein [Bacteroidales bacterium]